MSSRKVALITGAAARLGACTAKTLHERGCDVLLHCNSSVEQAELLAALDADALGDALRWEPSRGGALFPHLHRPMLLTDVSWHAPLPLVDGTHLFPEQMA